MDKTSRSSSIVDISRLAVLSAMLMVADCSSAAAEPPAVDGTKTPSGSAVLSRTETVDRDETVMIHGEKDQDIEIGAYRSKSAKEAAEKLKKIANLPGADASGLSKTAEPDSE